MAECPDRAVPDAPAHRSGPVETHGRGRERIRLKRAETRDYTNRLRGEARRLGLSRLHGRPSPTASFSTAGGAAGRGLSSALQRTCCPMRRRGEEGGSGGRPLHGAVRSGWRVAAGPLVVFAALLALPPQTQAQTVTTPAKPIPTLQCHNGDSREAYGSAKFDATLEIRPRALGFELDAIQVTKPSTYSNYLMAVAPSGPTLNRWVLRVQLIDAVTGNAVPYEDARGQFSLQVRADSFTSSHGVYNEASNILRTAYAHGSGRESLPPDVEVEVRAGERVECSLYVPDDGATT